MNLKLKYFLSLIFLSLVKSLKEKEICPIFNFLINDNSFSDNSLILPANKFSSNYYLNTITNLISQCEEHCEKCLELKTNTDTKCIKCDEGFFLYKFRCVEQCPNDTYFYTYKTKIITSGTENIVNIKACDENCEEGYTGIIFKENNEDVINKKCVLNYYENIWDYIVEKLDEFKTQILFIFNFFILG